MSETRPTLVDLPARAASGLVWVYQKTVSPAPMLTPVMFE